MNLITENKQDEITFQMGLNLRQYQEIEQIIKRLILFSSQTFKATSGINDDNEIFDQPKFDLWSNRANLERATLGNLLAQLEQTQHEPNYKDHDDNIHVVQVSLDYHIPLIAFLILTSLSVISNKLLPIEINLFIILTAFQSKMMIY